MGVRIVAAAEYRPPRVESAAELAPRVGRSERWILERTGVASRRVAEEPVDQMAAHAVRNLGVEPPDLLLFAAATPHRLIPDTAPFVLAALGWGGMPAWTVHATCLSFLAALRVARAELATGGARRVVVVSAERGTLGRDFADPESACLLGDGAAAVALEASEDSGVLAHLWRTYPEDRDLATYRGLGADFRNADAVFEMRGPRLYRKIRQVAGPFLDELFATAKVDPAEVRWVIPHQASGPGVRAWARYGFAPDRIVDIVAETGNCVAASLPMALATAAADGRLQRGDLVLLVGTGAGVSIAATLLRY